MKIFSLILILFSASILYGQETNVHIGFGSYYTAGVGADYRKDKNLISVDTAVGKICKKPGGCGYQNDVRATYARKVYKNLSLQGGVQNSYYKVDLFSKESFQALGGLRYSMYNEKLIGELNYRHDMTSENEVNFGELQLTGYLPKHFFIRGRALTKRFKDYYKVRQTKFDGLIMVGVHF